MRKTRLAAGVQWMAVLAGAGALAIGCGGDDDSSSPAVDASATGDATAGGDAGISADATTGADAHATGDAAGGTGDAGDAGDAGDTAPASSVGTLAALSNRADLVSGGDVLVQLVPGAGIDVTQVAIDVGGTDVTSAFAVRADGRFLGVVTGLQNGANLVTAKLAGATSATLTVTNHPISGPILYGPQIQPWGCDADAGDASCDRAVSYGYLYMSTDPTKSGLQPYDPAHPANDVATAATDHGTTVPFIVRVETGVQDRDYYDVAVLFDPTQAWSRWTPQPAWNRKLLIEHGSGCGNGYSQSNALSSQRVLDIYGLSRGFAVLAVSLNDAGHNCNLAVEAEATMMAKEHVVEAYGDLHHTFGYGTSGGALAQQWMANAYPGLYDGIITGLAFPDAGSTMIEVEDCALLLQYFGRTTVPWTDAQEAAASGHLNTLVCNEWINVYGFNNDLNPLATNLAVGIPGTAPTALGGCDAPASARYDAVTNPTGVRCDLQDSAISIFGKRAEGFANRPYSNVGVQYGLQALQAGTITVDQFIDLNASIGSHTIDYVPQAARVAADPGSIAASYQSGSINEGAGMASVAMIHLRPLDVTGIHHQYRSWAIARGSIGPTAVTATRRSGTRPARRTRATT